MRKIMKPKLIIKSLADLPANVLALAASVPGRAVNATMQVLTPPVRATRREIRAARQRSAAFVRALMSKAHARLKDIQPWTRGGLNE